MRLEARLGSLPMSGSEPSESVYRVEDFYSGAESKEVNGVIVFQTICGPVEPLPNLLFERSKSMDEGRR